MAVKHVPFKEIRNCEVCGDGELRKIHDQKYPGKQGIYRFVIYKCSRGHETRTRQLVVKQHAPDPEWWVS